eukprot:g5835.t1
MSSARDMRNDVHPLVLGWLYAERITVAIRMAAAKKEMFDDVVMSNEDDVYLRVRTWSGALRFAASSVKHERERTIGVMLDAFEAVLYRMKFTVPSDTKLVRGIMHDVVERFKENWQSECDRQMNMAKRAREILLRWGEFSEEYVERAGFLREDHDDSTLFGTILRFLVVLFMYGKRVFGLDLFS